MTPQLKTYLMIFVNLHIASSNLCQAQERPRHEVQMGYGPLAREHVIDDWGNSFFASIFNEPQPKIDFSNSYSITYRYQPRRRLAISAMSGFATHTTYETNYAASKQSGYVFAFETKMIYMDRPIVQLYAVTGLGILLIRTKDFRPSDDGKTTKWPTCQLTPIGIRIGRKVGGFAELGYGYKGILSFGVSARF